MKNLEKGSTGALVGVWQSFLTEYGFFPGPVDNQFGDQTVLATKEFQTVHNLPPTGSVGDDLFYLAKQCGFTDLYIYKKWEKGLLSESTQTKINLGRGFLENVTYDKYKQFFNKYVEELRETKYLRDPSICWSDKINTINVIVIRCNDIYITNDIQRNNDWLVVIENRTNDTFIKYVFQVTADPKYRKDKIANLCEQIYFGNSRNHKSIPKRIAICQDTCQIYVKRYKGPTWWEDLGRFGINIHNSNGLFNSSLGCVILAKEDDYINEFRPLLNRVEKSKIPVAVIRNTDFERLIV